MNDYSPSYSTRMKSGTSPSLSRPFKSFNSMTQAHSTTLAPTLLINFMDAPRVPPVAMRSSMMTTRSPAVTAPTCISILSLPYSKVYSSPMTSPGSFFGFLKGTNLAPMARATGAPKMNPRASTAATTSIFRSL
eukprot:TRINITY_DN4712_c0_g1_i1.p1 TRINITY_DN4712_c0_g1~~TRINITY_DN4712_c0_g1_i1.p1  ORF type:complete len:134 (+),score=4.44 TRINITY_DN4712_c0_g1_i1:190-591(+)